MMLGLERVDGVNEHQNLSCPLVRESEVRKTATTLHLLGVPESARQLFPFQ